MLNSTQSAFSFLYFETFKVLGNEVLGAEFLPSIACGNNQVCLISVRHGRAVSMEISELNWINIKGVGWTFGGPHIYRSRKDQNMMFGLMDERDAVREKQVSDYLQTINPHAPKILGYKSFRDIQNAEERYGEILRARHTCGEEVNPCILYTQIKSPFRMADVAFFTDSQKDEILSFYCSYFKCSRSEFIKTFAFHLAEQIGLYHKKGIINDSLYWDNITLCAEIVDYEWLTVPGMVLPNGQDTEHIIPNERKEKEIVYAIEAILRMASLFHLETDFYTVLDALIEGYKVHNRDLMQKCPFIQRLYDREKFIF